MGQFRGARPFGLAGSGEVDRPVPGGDPACNRKHGPYPSWELRCDKSQRIGFAFESRRRTAFTLESAGERLLMRRIDERRGAQTRVGPEGFSTSTRVVTSKVRQQGRLHAAQRGVPGSGPRILPQAFPLIGENRVGSLLSASFD